MLILKRFATAVAVVACMASTVGAAPLVVPGDNFDVVYDSDLEGLFGAPSLAGNVLSWAPTSFSALSDGGRTVANSTFAFQVIAHAHYVLSSASVSEGGAYYLYAEDGGIATTVVSGQLRVNPLPGTNVVTSPIVTSTAFVANAFGDTALRPWSAAAAAIAMPAGTKSANVSFENVLVARVRSGPGEAYIAKTEASMAFVVTHVPEPGTYVLMLAGLSTIGLLVARRRQG